MGIFDYNKTPALNTAISGINIAEGWAPQNVNDAIRQLLADIAAGLVPSIQVTPQRFGAKADGIADDTAAVNAAYAYLVGKGGGTLYFPAGTYKCNLTMSSRLVHLSGEGRRASILTEADPNKDIITVLYREGSWSMGLIEKLCFHLPNTAGFLGTAIGFGENAFQPTDQFSCATIVRDCSFWGFDKTLHRRQGQIGLWLTGNDFNYTNYHVYSVGFTDPPTGNAIMHAGCLFSQWNHYLGAQKAVFYTESYVVGTGQVSICDDIIEANPGFIHYIRGFNDNDGTPAYNVQRCWNEANCTAVNLTINGTVHAKAKFLYAKDCARVEMVDCPQGEVELRGITSLLLDRCDIKLLVLVKDLDSSVTIKRAWGFGGFEMKYTVDDILGSFLTPPTAGAGVWFPMRCATKTTKEFAPKAAMFGDASAIINFTGTALRSTTAAAVGDPVPPLFDNAQDLVINAGETLLPVANTASPGAGKWAVLKYMARLKSGAAPSVSFTGATGDVGSFTPTSEWRMYVSIFKVGSGGANTLYHYANGNGVISIGGFSCVEFDDRSTALIYANANTLART